MHRSVDTPWARAESGETGSPHLSGEHIWAWWLHIGLFAISLQWAPKDHQIRLCKSSLTLLTLPSKPRLFILLRSFFYVFSFLRNLSYIIHFVVVKLSRRKKYFFLIYFSKVDMRNIFGEVGFSKVDMISQYLARPLLTRDSGLRCT